MVSRSWLVEDLTSGNSCHQVDPLKDLEFRDKTCSGLFSAGVMEGRVHKLALQLA